MPLSFRNLIDTNQLADALTTGDYTKVVKKKNQNLAKYVKGYAQDSAVEALANSIDPNMSLDLFRRAMGLENKKLDSYDPYHTSDAKIEEFWYNDRDTKVDGKTIQSQYDEDTNLFKRGLYSNPELGGYRQTDYWYEDPFYPTFELFFDNNSPLFVGYESPIEQNITNNSLKSFISKYQSIDTGYIQRYNIWQEFNKVFFKIFEKKINYDSNNRNRNNKSYYITKIAGLENLIKKITNYGEDKISITLNEDVSMFAYYLSELYNNLVYSYRNKRFMFPENVIRFDLTILINDIRIFQMPQSKNQGSTNVPANPNYIDNKNIGYAISPKSTIIYTLHDCTFNFFESKNYQNEIEIGGYGGGPSYSPQSITFDIFYKSVTRSSTFPLIKNSLSIDAWQSSLYTEGNNNSNKGTNSKYFQDLKRINNENVPQSKSFLNNLLAKGTQTVVNAAANYADNLETKLREVRGSAVNGLLQQFRNTTNINKIEPDNVYSPDFNNRISVKNLGSQVASGLLNELENTVKRSANF